MRAPRHMPGERTIILAERESREAADRAAFLGESGFHVVSVSETESLLEAAATVRPLLILLDLGLPGPGCGVGAARSLFAHGRVELLFLVAKDARQECLHASETLPSAGYLESDASPYLALSAINRALRSAEAERGLAMETARLRAAVRAHPDVMIVLDETGTYLDVLTSNESLLYRPTSFLLGRKIVDLFEPSLALPFQELIESAARGEKTEPFEYELPTPAGLRRFEGRAAPVGRVGAWSEEGKRLVVFIARDVTARRLAEEETRRAIAEKDMLLRELQHRVKNNLAMMSSLFSLEAGRVARSEDRAVFANAQDRLRALSYLYDKLYCSDEVAELEMGSYIRELAEELYETYVDDPERIAIEFSVEGSRLELKRAVPLGLALTELVTNALKHGFPQGGRGRIHVSFAPVGKELILRVEDDGTALPAGFDPRKSEGTGTRLVALLASQLDGQFSWTPGAGEKGAVFELAFPAEPSRTFVQPIC